MATKNQPCGCTTLNPVDELAKRGLVATEATRDPRQELARLGLVKTETDDDGDVNRVWNLGCMRK